MAKLIRQVVELEKELTLCRRQERVRLLACTWYSRGGIVCSCSKTC